MTYEPKLLDHLPFKDVELILNAKDVHQNGKVRIKVTFNGDDDLLFEHDGKPFTAENIRFLIE